MSEKHKRNSNGDVLLDSVDFGYTRKTRAQTLTERNERSFWIAATTFVGAFSIMVIALGVTMVGNHSLAAQLEDMTHLYNFEVSKQQYNYATPDNVNHFLPEYPHTDYEPADVVNGEIKYLCQDPNEFSTLINRYFVSYIC